MQPTDPAPVVVKIGGALVDDQEAMASLWQALLVLQRAAPVVLVHGGGPQATSLARRLGHEPHIVQGRRITTDLDLEIVQWTMRGALNARLAAQAARHTLRGVGLSGVDGGILRVTKRPPWNVDGARIDFGWVGDVEHVDTALLLHLTDAGYLPIVAPLGLDAEGRLYNVNADTVARVLAEALDASQLFLVTEAGGLMRHVEEPDSHLAQCDPSTFAAGVEAGWIGGGMRVKLQVAFEALHAGIPHVYILPPHDLLTRKQATRVVSD